MDIHSALRRLREISPLAERKKRLPPPLAGIHTAILRSFVERGRPLSAREVVSLTPDGDGQAALDELARNDLVVLSADGTAVVGAYPMTTEETPHRLELQGHTIHAMCALDALAVSPMFATEVIIDSVCDVTGDPVHLVQHGRQIVDAAPSGHVHVGIRWQQTKGTAAHSL